MTLVRVGHICDFSEGQWVFRIVEVNEREVGILKWRDEFFAVRNQCPHLAGPLCGYVKPHVVAEPTSLTPMLDFDRPIVVCGWHHWEFDMRTGQALLEPRMKAKTMPVVLDDEGNVFVDVAGRAPKNVAPGGRHRRTAGT